jgi:hypothetical protein
MTSNKNVPRHTKNPYKKVVVKRSQNNFVISEDVPSGFSMAARITRRPIRPKPLIPILVGMFQFFLFRIELFLDLSFMVALKNNANRGVASNKLSRDASCSHLTLWKEKIR